MIHRFGMTALSRLAIARTDSTTEDQSLRRSRTLQAKRMPPLHTAFDLPEACSQRHTWHCVHVAFLLGNHDPNTPCQRRGIIPIGTPRATCRDTGQKCWGSCSVCRVHARLGGKVTCVQCQILQHFSASVKNCTKELHG